MLCLGIKNMVIHTLIFHLITQFAFYVYNDISYLSVLGCSGGERKKADPKEKDDKRILKYKIDGSGTKTKIQKNIQKIK